MSDIAVLRTEDVPAEVLEDVRQLLDVAFAGSFSADDWTHSLGGWHVIVGAAGTVVAHAAIVPRLLRVGSRPMRAGYVEAVATAPDHQRSGIGSQVMTEVGVVVRREFELGALSTGRHSFYERLGWERWRGPTYVLTDGQPARTAAEDDGVMVLRCGPSETVDLGESIHCEARTGDDW